MGFSRLTNGPLNNLVAPLISFATPGRVMRYGDLVNRSKALVRDRAMESSDEFVENELR